MTTNTDLKAFDTAGLKPFFAPADETHLPNASVRLSSNHRLVARQTRRLLKVLAKTRAATSTIGRLPEADESFHFVLNGEFALWDFVPAVLALSGQPITELIIATLGFSKANITALGDLVDAGQVQSVAIACSTYFGAADRDIFAQAIELCQKHGFRVAALRTHAKLLLIRTGSRHLVIESSANLRSCHNTEQASMFDDASLYDFHRKWIDEMLTAGGAP